MRRTAPPLLDSLAAELARRGVTIAELAEKVGSNPQHLGRVIRGTAHPSAALRARVALVLEVPEAELFVTPVERLVRMAVEQGLGRHVSDPAVLARVATFAVQTITTPSDASEVNSNGAMDSSAA